MTISTYSDPALALAPVNNLSESPHEIYGYKEQDSRDGSFADILAGVIQNNETSEADSRRADDTSGLQNDDDLSAEQLIFKSVLENVSADFPEIAGVNQIDTTEFIDDDDLLDEISVGFFNLVLNTENQIINSNDQISISTDELSINEISGDQLAVNNGLKIETLSDSAITEIDPHQGELDAQVASLDDDASAVKNFANGTQNIAAEQDEALAAETEKKPDLQKEQGLAKNETNSKSYVELKQASLQNGQDAGNKRFDDSNQTGSDRNRRRDKISFDVRDLRTAAKNENTGDVSKINTAVDVKGRVDGSSAGSSVRELTLELKLPDFNSNSTGQNAAVTAWDSKAGNSLNPSNALENLLARELHQNFNGDIVRHSSMILRDGGEGIIRLNLKPESLGNVKIRLEMTDNKITGHIFVESEEALDAFRKEVSSLEQAFKDAGFTNADLNLSYADSGKNTEWMDKEINSVSSRIAAVRYDGDKRVTRVDVLFGQRPGSINLLA